MFKKKKELFTDEYSEIIKCWIIRVLYDLKGYAIMNVRYGLDEYERTLTLLKQKDLLDKYEDDTMPRKVFRKILKSLSDEYEKKKNLEKGVLFENSKALGQLVGLNTTEQKLLIFAVLLNSSCELEEATDILGDMSLHVLINMLSVILNEERADVRHALAADGLLNRTGLLRVQRDGRSQMIYHITLMEDIATILLNDEQTNIMQALTQFFVPGQAASLSMADYSHLQKDYDLLKAYLKTATDNGKAGVNILLFGAPGTGKTELVRTLADDLQVELYEVTTDTQGDGDFDADRARLDSYLLCQQVLKRKKQTLILFDEIEDAFIRDGAMERFGIRTSTDAKKGKHNHMLEVNPVPAIWVSNVISHIDEAIIRRFDYVLELKIPPKSSRVRILQAYTQGLNVSENWINQVAKNDHLAPALIARAVNVVKDLALDNEAETEANLERILANTLNAMGYDKSLSGRKQSLITYRLDALNPDYDLESLQTGLTKASQGCFCLYGPPGTGKSEFARHLADHLDKSLLVKRASDLLNAYIGATEQNIKEMFEQARDEDALLLCDEADSFLRDRSRARESWEVTQVNELLTQMEQYDGLFICTTNLMETLDQASLRRFDLKIKFDYLKPEQSWALFQQTLIDQNNPLDEAGREKWEKKVKALQGVTPGDYATTVRQSRFSDKLFDAKQLFAGLEREIKFKQYGAFKGIGFIAS
jgi:SpoVK/Ycf46/Vps4 family AAA+-type ATPase